MVGNPARPDGTGKVLIVVHQRHSTPGRVGELLEARGLQLDQRCPGNGDPLPRSLEDYAAAVIFGGPMSANDEHLPGIRAELEWLPAALRSGRPLFGICLGAQLIARALGARVGPHPAGLVEIGYHEVRPSPGGHGVLERPMMFYQWHSETFELPAGATRLAENSAFLNQAFRYDDRVFGVEFHPEMTRAMIDRWTSSADGSLELARAGAQDREAQLEGYDRYGPASDRWLARLLDEHLLDESEAITN